MSGGICNNIADTLQRLAVESRLRKPSLPAPEIPFAVNQPIAKQQRKHLISITLKIIAIVFLQYVLREIRIINHIRMALEKTEAEDIRIFLRRMRQEANRVEKRLKKKPGLILRRKAPRSRCRFHCSKITIAD